MLDFYLGIKGDGNLASHLSSGNVKYSLKLSIGIVNYNTADLTKKLLESIFKKDSGFDPETMEVIVLDNGLLDPCSSWIKKFNVKYLQNKDNAGFSKGYNKTIKYSLGEYYLMLNSDIEVLKGGISKLIEVADEFKEEVVIGGKLFFPDMSNQDSAFHLPTLSGAFKEYFLARKGSYFMFMPKSLGGVSGPPGSRLDSRPPMADPPRWVQVEGLVMACFMIPKKIIEKVGLLDEGSFIFFEDIEYCRRLKSFDIPLYFVPDAKFIHHHGASTKKIGQEKAVELLQKAAQHYHGKIY